MDPDPSAPHPVPNGNMATSDLPEAEDSFGGARPKQYSNVIVDDSPLQNQMERNKECE